MAGIAQPRPPARASSQAPCAVGAQPASALKPIACTFDRIRARSLRGPPKSRSVVLTSISTAASSAATTFGEYCSIAMVTRACAAASAQASRSYRMVWGAMVCTPPRRMCSLTPALTANGEARCTRSRSMTATAAV